MDGEIIKQRLKRTLNPSGDYIGEIYRILAGSEKKLTEVQKRELSGCIFSNVLAFLCVMFTAAAIYVASIDPKALTNRYYIYSALIVVPILAGSMLILPIFRAGTTIFGFASIALGAIVAIAAIYYFMRNMNAATVKWANYLLFVFVAFLIVSSLAIAYRFLIKYLKNINGWNGFIIKLIFFIPCLLLDFVEYMINDYNNTPKIVGIIFVLQVLVIMLYIIIPKLYRKFMSFTQVKLLDKPLYLTREYVIGNNDDLRKYEYIDTNSYMRFDKVSPDGTLADEYSKNYTISMWLFVNEGAKIGKNEIPIFKYGNSVEGTGRGKPYLVYNPLNGDRPYTIYYSDGDGSSIPKYDFTMYSQKWNHVAITYNNNKVDLFVNGELINSHTFSTGEITVGGGASLPLYSKFDTITVGYGHPNKKTRGINGAICNVVYYRSPLKNVEVISHYHLLAKSNPPI